jgi:hypothetical protein
MIHPKQHDASIFSLAQKISAKQRSSAHLQAIVRLRATRFRRHFSLSLIRDSVGGTAPQIELGG